MSYLRGFFNACRLLLLQFIFNPHWVSISLSWTLSNLLALYAVRWLSLSLPNSTFSFLPTYPQVAYNASSGDDVSIDMTFLPAMFYASIIYWIWQALYFIFILVLKHEKVCVCVCLLLSFSLGL
jgi:hypothetical protein